MPDEFHVVDLFISNGRKQAKEISQELNDKIKLGWELAAISDGFMFLRLPSSSDVEVTALDDEIETKNNICGRCEHYKFIGINDKTEIRHGMCNKFNWSTSETATCDSWQKLDVR